MDSTEAPALPNFLLLTMAAVVGAFAPLRAIAVHRAEGDLLGFQAPGLWLFVVALGFLLWRALSLLSDAAAERGAPRALGLLVPGLFGARPLYLWQVGVPGLGVPSVLLPSPAQKTGTAACRERGCRDV